MLNQDINLRDRVTDMLYRAVDELNRQLPAKQTLNKSAKTSLLGHAEGLDSLGFVNFIVITEQLIENTFNVHLTLADDLLVTGETDAFQSLGSLADHIAFLLENKLNA